MNAPTPAPTESLSGMIERVMSVNEKAQQRVREFRLLLKAAPEEIDTDLIFHDEPFALACRLARP